MKRAVEVAAGLTRGAYRAWERKWSFLFLLILTFSVTVAGLGRLDLLPERVAVLVVAAQTPGIVLEATSLTQPEAPTTISIASIGLSASIANPTSTNIAVLDSALLSGAVRYPTSAKLGENGNVVLFGHSSYLPVVQNQAFKTFDGIQDLKQGETIVVSSATRSYTYAVTSVAKAKAESGVIPLQVTGQVLTLATCDSFGTKSDRFIVTAEFVESHLLSS